MKPSDLRLCEATLSTQFVPFRTPIKFGGRVMREMLLVDVAVEAETRDGRHGRGFGSMPLGNVWAWPSAVAGPAETQNVMLALAEELVRQANDDRQPGHPLEITRRLAASHAETSRRVAVPAGLPEADPAARATRGRQPLGSGHPRRLRQDPRPQQLRPPRAGMGQRRPSGLSGRAVCGRVSRPLHPPRAAADDAVVSPRRRARSAQRRRPCQPRRRRPAGNAGRVDRRRRTHASENQAQRRRFGVGRSAGVVDRTRGGRGPGGPRLSRLAIFGRFQ